MEHELRNKKEQATLRVLFIGVVTRGVNWHEGIDERVS